MSQPDKLTRKELNQFLETQRNHIIDLEICISNIKTIILPDKTDSGTVESVREFAGHYVSLAYSYSAITIFKLFSEKEKRSFLKLMNKLENCKLSKELLVRFEESHTNDGREKTILTKKEINELVSELRILVAPIRPALDLLADRRNTFYAHRDPDKKFRPEKLSEIDEINKTAQVIFNKLNAKFKGTSVIFDNMHWSIDVIF